MEVHWQNSRLSMVLPLNMDGQETTLHAVEIGLDGNAWIDGTEDKRLKEVLARCSHLPLSVRWLLRRDSNMS